MPKAMSEEQLMTLDLVVWHLRMADRTLSRTFLQPVIEVDEGYRLDYVLHTFTTMHLLATLFLLDRPDGEPMGGYCYRALRTIGMEKRLRGIAGTLRSRLGPVTLGEFLRHSRNKLATHGLLRDQDLPFAIGAIRQPKVLEKYERLMNRLHWQIHQVCEALGKTLERERAKRLTYAQ
jgi:hypothetical protein